MLNHYEEFELALSDLLEDFGPALYELIGSDLLTDEDLEDLSFNRRSARGFLL